MQRYQLEFILHSYNVSLQTVKSSLSEFGDSLEVAELISEARHKGGDFKININTEDPTVIFDICGQFGRIRSVKVNEIK